ncbi:MAG: hypothetical protein LBK59_03080 [Bifidobacteriaceae bacterium]|jgi:hypothetical protein|nr:hypothetical protein [Bifidobacteriaceae bacterium]
MTATPSRPVCVDDSAIVFLDSNILASWEEISPTIEAHLKLGEHCLSGALTSDNVKLIGGF